VIGPQAGHYWTHLTPELLSSGAPDHGFHVFGVYPWSRLLGSGPEPLHVLDSCRIRWGVVLNQDEDGVEVSTRHLSWDGAALDLGEAAVERIPAANVQVDVTEGDQVALHWEWLCDHLTATQQEALEQSTRHQLAATTTRLGGT